MYEDGNKVSWNMFVWYILIEYMGVGNINGNPRIARWREGTKIRHFFLEKWSFPNKNLWLTGYINVVR